MVDDRRIILDIIIPLLEGFLYSRMINIADGTNSTNVSIDATNTNPVKLLLLVYTTNEITKFINSKRVKTKRYTNKNFPSTYLLSPSLSFLMQIDM
ncbi:hypothetical protein SDC9_195058 [bioreactor metagenome]|uniref:Uncharacterized protein n=1 Tax=bioreactor metagenome TaxID=1076179 RepID=A0A645I970_9ZZZZ